METRSRRRSRNWGRLAVAGLLAACGERGAPSRHAAIELERGPSIRDSGDSVVLTDRTILAVGAGGQLIAFPVAGPRQIAFHDSLGRLVQSIGPKGKGPGEFTNVGSAALGPGDSIFVGDASNGRVSVLSPVDHREVRTLPARLAEAYFTGTPEGRLLSPAVERRDGKLKETPVRRVGWSDSTITPIATGVPMNRFAAMAAAPGGNVWIADRLIYMIRLFDGDRVVRTIRREPDWFPPDSSPITTFAWMGKGRPFISSVSEDADGNLWVLIKRRNPAWKGSARPIEPGTPISRAGLPPLGEVFEGVLEVIDREGSLLDSRVVPGDMIRFVAPGKLYQRTDADSSGALMLQVWNARLRR